MLALCLILSVTYYAQNYARIIGRSLIQCYSKVWLLKCMIMTPQITVLTTDPDNVIAQLPLSDFKSKIFTQCI